MSEKVTVEELSQDELNALIERVEYAIENDLSVSTGDLKLLLTAITTLCTLQQKLEDNDVTLHKMRKLLGMVQQSERRHTESKGKKRPSDFNNSKKENKPKPKPKVPVSHHKMEKYKIGQQCPDCQKGKLYKYEPGKLLRITGHSPYEAVRHITEQLRCNACQELHTAPLPDEVLADGHANQTYGYSARSLMAIHKFYSGIPYYHQGNLANIFGYSVSASTVFDQCELVADAVMPVFYEMKRQASDAPSFMLDDTHNRILEQKPELRDKRNGKGKQLRTGIYSSGLIALTEAKKEIVLFETSLGHAGELLDDVLRKRSPNLPSPLIMSDALSNNNPTVMSALQANCNSHCRRQFVDLEARHPETIAWVLDTYKIIWKAEHHTKENNHTPEERLAYHKEHSLPAMEQLREWAVGQQQSARFEEHCPLGKAINYLLRHYKKLTLFCVVAGALIDNNRMEETLKIVIRIRKTSHFYKTKNGAGVANVLTSLIATSHRAEINIFHYLIALQQNKDAVQASPSSWMPWNYELQLAEHKKYKPDKAA